MSKVAVLFGTQRCGSNFFLSAARKLENLQVLGEMYHQHGAFPFQVTPKEDFYFNVKLCGIISGLAKGRSDDEFSYACRRFVTLAGATEFGAGMENSVNRELVAFAHRYPNRYFDVLELSCSSEHLLFKIFPEHLDLKQVFSVLLAQKPRVILMTRNPVDTFISFKKLVETKKPQDVDTSALKINFSRSEYFAYKAGLMTYYNAIKDFCDEEGIPVTVVDYDTIHNSSGIEKTDVVKAEIEKAFGTNFQWSDERRGLKLFQKQDKSESVEQKVQDASRLPRRPQKLISD